MDLNEADIKDLFLKYEDIRKSGKYNMITDANEIVTILDCDISTYAYIINNYTVLKKLYL